MKIPKSDRARRGNKIYRNGMNSKADDYGQRSYGIGPQARKLLKRKAARCDRKNARDFCRRMRGH